MYNYFYKKKINSVPPNDNEIDKTFLMDFQIVSLGLNYNTSH